MRAGESVEIGFDTVHAIDSIEQGNPFKGRGRRFTTAPSSLRCYAAAAGKPATTLSCEAVKAARRSPAQASLRSLRKLGCVRRRAGDQCEGRIAKPVATSAVD